MHTLGVVIRPAVVGDASVLADLGDRTFRDGFGPENTEADMAAYLRRSFGPEIQAREIADRQAGSSSAKSMEAPSATPASSSVKHLPASLGSSPWR